MKGGAKMEHIVSFAEEIRKTKKSSGGVRKKTVNESISLGMAWKEEAGTVVGSFVIGSLVMSDANFRINGAVDVLYDNKEKLISIQSVDKTKYYSLFIRKISNVKGRGRINFAYQEGFPFLPTRFHTKDYKVGMDDEGLSYVRFHLPDDTENTLPPELKLEKQAKKMAKDQGISIEQAKKVLLEAEESTLRDSLQTTSDERSNGRERKYG